MSAQLAKVVGQLVLDRKEQLLRLGLPADDLPEMWLFQNSVGEPMDDSKEFPTAHVRIPAHPAGRVAEVHSGPDGSLKHQDDRRHLRAFSSWG